jgi:hypothetical protein
MEPFEVLRDMIRENVDHRIGGAPQVAKVHRFMRTQHFAVNWPNVDYPPHALGRPQLPYERFDLPTIDPDHPQFLPKRSTASQDFDIESYWDDLAEREERE